MKNRLVKWLVCIFLFLSAGSSVAIEQRTTNEVSIKHSSVVRQNNIRQQWSLSEKEWSKYKELMKGIRGSLSVPNISPLEVLGIHAETEQERKKYAKAWAKIMKEDTERVLRFQYAFDDAAKELNNRAQMVDTAKLSRLIAAQSQNGLSIQAKDRVLLFVRLNDCSRCQARAVEILADISKFKKVQFDIFFIDTTKGKDDKKIRQWTEEAGIKRNLLIKGRVTVNHNKKLINKYFGFTASVPIAAVIRNNKINKL